MGAVQGWTAPGFERVRTAFEQNFSDRGEVGAAFAAYAADRLVVDLWGGLADERARAPWRRDTLQLVFSGAKGLVATAALLLVGRGRLELDAPVCRYWPEFAAAGKAGVLVRQLLDHTAGLPGVRVAVEEADVLDGRRMAALLAEQAPYWRPGSRLSDHALTFGWLLGELIRRVDGRSVGRFVRDEISAPLGLDTWIGLPAEHGPRAARTTRRAEGLEAPDGLRQPEPGGQAWSVWENPPLFYGERFVWNDPRFHAAEIPGANAITTARSMACFYSRLVTAGRDASALLGRDLLDRAISDHSRGCDPFTGHPFRFGLGFQLQTELAQLGPPACAFGHGGAGGSTHGAWPEHGVAFSYVMNQMRGDPRDARPLSLLDALAQSREPAARTSAASRALARRRGRAHGGGGPFDPPPQ